MGGFGGSPVVALPGGGTGGGGLVELWPRFVSSNQAVNLGAGAFFAPNDPFGRLFLDLRGVRFARLYAVLQTPVAATKIRVQYHPTGPIDVADGDAGWQPLLTSAGGHPDALWFDTGDVAVPLPARVAACLIRAGMYDGDGAGDPQIYAAFLLLT